MPVKLGTTDRELEYVLMRKAQQQSYFQDIQDFLQEQNTKKQPGPQQCSVEVMKKITVVLQEELAKQQFQDAVVMISAIQFTTRFPDYPAGLPVLLSNGLIDLLAYALEETQKYVSLSDGTEVNLTADSLFEVILETVNDVADFSEHAKRQSVGVFTEKLMQLFVDKNKNFHVRMEAIRTLNLLLEGCLDEVIQVLREYPPSLKRMGLMADLLTTAGDFEMQVACTESLARLVKRSDKASSNLIKDWFSDPHFATAFMEIRDDTFETDCRKFLNSINSSLGSKQSVFSLPCLSAHLGSFKLRCPDDVNLQDFWVDFNTVSRRITLYVADEELQKENEEGGMWETVTIQNEAVEKFRLSERVGRQALFISLNVPASELLGFCPSDDKCAHIVFDAKVDVRCAAVAVFGQDKLRHSKHKTSVSKVSIQVHVDDSSNSPGPWRNIRSADESSDSISIQSAKIYGLGGTDDESSGLRASRSKPIKTDSEARAPTKHKVSVPLSPMWTPTMAKNVATQRFSSTKSVASAESSSSVKPLCKKSDFAQPQTPVTLKSSTKRVKTPLQIVVSDKATDSAAESEISCPSIGKKASISSGVSISSCGTPTGLRLKLQREAMTRQQQTSGLQDAKPGSGSRSDPGPTSSASFQQAGMQPHPSTTRLQNGLPSRIDGHRSDPGSSTCKDGLPQQKRQLRSRVNKHDAPEHQQEPPRRDGGYRREEQVSSGGEEESKRKKPSRKFRLYSDSGGMMTEAEEDSQEASNTDLVIPSTIPTEESPVDVIPDSLPPSGQLQPDEATSNTSRIQNRSNFGRYHPVAHSPSLSTLTEESAQSAKGRSTKTTATIISGSEAPTANASLQRSKMTLQEEVIQEVLSEEGVLSSRVAAGSSCPETCHNSKMDAGKVQERWDARVGPHDKNSNAKDDSEKVGESCEDADVIIIDGDEVLPDVPSGNKKLSKPDQKGDRREDEEEYDQDTDVDKTKAAKNRGKAPDDKSRPLPPSRAFRKVPLQMPDSSQELFTSQMEARPRRGRPTKKAWREGNVKKQPKKQGGKSAKERPPVEEPRLRARSQRAAAKAAEREIRTLSQSFDSCPEANDKPTSGMESSDSSHPIIKKSKGKKTENETEKKTRTSRSLKALTNLSARSSQDSADLSVYDFVEVEVERSSSSDSVVKKPHLRTAGARKRGQLLKSTQEALDISVYDFADSESCQSVSLQPCIKKKPSLPTKAARNIPAKVNALAQHAKSRKHQRVHLEQSDKPLKTSKKLFRNSQELWDTDDDQINVSSRLRSKNKTVKPPPSPEELSDIEQPRDAPQMSFLSRNAQLSPVESSDDQYLDQDVHSFVKSFTNRERKRAAEAVSELMSESRKSRCQTDKRGEKSRRERPRSGRNTYVLDKEQVERPSKKSSTASVEKQRQSSREPISSRKPSWRRKGSSFGVEIVEDESEEVPNREDAVSISSDDDANTDTVSVENFSKVCQSLVNKSGRGLATKQSYRNIPKIYYQSQDSEWQSNDEEHEGAQEEEPGSLAASPEPPRRSSKKRREPDVVSERSWLAEKPMQKDEKPALPRKRKQNPLKSSQEADVDSLDMCLFYYRENHESSSLSDSQLRRSSANKTLLDNSTRSEKTVKSMPRCTSTPWSLHWSSQEEGKEEESSIEVARDDPDRATGDIEEDLYPLTPSVLVEDMQAGGRPDLVTPKSLKISSSISSRGTSSSGKTPKQVTFDSDPNYAEDFTPVIEEDCLKSGPSSRACPTASTLKRKYGDIFNDDDGEDDGAQVDGDTVVSSDGEDADGDVPPCGLVPHSGQGSLRPKKLFKARMTTTSSNSPEVEMEDTEDTSTGDIPSSFQSLGSFPTMQITKMFKTITSTHKQRMLTEQRQARQLTEGAVKTTKREVSKLWSQQHQARSEAQEEFKSRLLAEIVSLEDELGHLKDVQRELQATLEQHCHMTASTLLKHIQRVKSLHSQHETDSGELNRQLGRHLQHGVRQVLHQEMVNMHKLLIQDAQQHELQQMRKGLLNIFRV
ncbi:uncharacterized protein LOC110980487 isoform X2 [Acanthaster planci]|uniref:Uncharacterized protein LOC110980487 isoform X2 n=1 Tax=Acanthaster planci TaxID=133434 RepID=A0A8B7YN58_ACAPL|nr:uncharacterized protein LOC110980487 isoform X2 [Acanthaster planci]